MLCITPLFPPLHSTPPLLYPSNSTLLLQSTFELGVGLWSLYYTTSSFSKHKYLYHHPFPNSSMYPFSMSSMSHIPPPLYRVQCVPQGPTTPFPCPVCIIWFLCVLAPHVTDYRLMMLCIYFNSLLCHSCYDKIIQLGNILSIGKAIYIVIYCVTKGQ